MSKLKKLDTGTDFNDNSNCQNPTFVKTPKVKTGFDKKEVSTKPIVVEKPSTGTKEGFDNKLTKAVSSSVPIPVIASGGVGTLQHLVDGIKEGGAEAVLAASIFHYSEFSIQEAKEAMLKSGLEIRI